MRSPRCFSTCMCFYYNHTATTNTYTLSLHDALPISLHPRVEGGVDRVIVQGYRECVVLVRHTARPRVGAGVERVGVRGRVRSEEHTSELQSRLHLVCRLLLEKKKIKDL